MNALHCPATLVLASPGQVEGSSSQGGDVPRAGGARALPATLHGRRIASIWCSDADGALREAEQVAAALDVRVVRPLPGLRETDLDSTRLALEEIADTHRGETALVLADRVALRVVVRALLPDVPGWDGDAGQVLEVEHDGAGWAVRDRQDQR